LIILQLLLVATWPFRMAAGLHAADTLDVARLPVAPVVDGRANEREYGKPTLEFSTAAGNVRVWVGQHGDFIHLAAVVPDSTFYWGDDFVVSVDPDGSGGASPGIGDRQWYLRRVLDSSVATVADHGRWYSRGNEPPMLGATRHQPDWDVASTSSATEWTVELRIRTAAVKAGTGAPRIAFRTYNDRPSGWWSWPAPPPGEPAQRVEQSPALWVPLRVR
jgi:hypothetical protein